MVHSLDNIIGAAKVHTEFTWPKKARVFVICEEPHKLISDTVGESGCDEATIAGVYALRVSLWDRLADVILRITDSGEYFVRCGDILFFRL